MKNNVDRVRRRLSVALCAGALLAPMAVQAQDPRGALVQRAARDWLAIADTYDAAATWKAAGPRFREAIPLDRWTEGLTRERKPRGAVLQRAVATTTFGSTFPGLPDGGSYALVRFRTSFADRPVSEEDVSLEQNADGTWQVIGYVIS